MRTPESDQEHIWLRQAATFTTHGQTRTVEIAIPVRPGATPEDVETLLAEADRGMARLSQHLDARVAEMLAAPVPAPQGAAAVAPAPAASTAPVPSPVAAPVAPRQTPAAPQLREAPAPAAPESRPPARRPAPPAARPATPATPAAPATTPAPPERARPSRPLPAAAMPDGAPLSIAEFISAIAPLGLNPKQAMDQLGVRSLQGLNLREALESLRRQSLPSEAASATPPPAAARETSPAPSANPRYFEEEDEAPDYTFTVVDGRLVEGDDDGLATGPSGAPARSVTRAGGGLDEYGDPDAPDMDDALDDPYGAYADDDDDLDDLEDVPDFAPPVIPPAAPATRGAGRATRQPAAESAPTPPSALAAGAGQARGVELLAHLRTARAGGTPAPHQRNAYANVFVDQLGEPQATALVRGIWRETPDRLGPEQLDVLIRWGKEDDFSDEVALVSAAIRAERARANGSQGGTADARPGTDRAPDAPGAPRATGRARSGEPRGSR